MGSNVIIYQSPYGLYSMFGVMKNEMKEKCLLNSEQITDYVKAAAEWHFEWKKENGRPMIYQILEVASELLARKKWAHFSRSGFSKHIEMYFLSVGATGCTSHHLRNMILHFISTAQANLLILRWHS